MKKKIVIALTSLVLTLSFATVAMAGTYSNPAEIISSLTGKSQTEIYEQRTEGKTFGQIAQEYQVEDQFRKEMAAYKKDIIDQRVKDGVLTEEKGAAIKKALDERIANCTGTPNVDKERLGQKFNAGAGFGKGQCFAQGEGKGVHKGQGFGKGMKANNRAMAQ